MVDTWDPSGGGTLLTTDERGVSVNRRIRSAGDRSSLVTLIVRNGTNEAVSVRIRERVLDDDVAVEPIRGPHRQSETWDYRGNRIDHEIAVPADDERMVIYEIEQVSRDPELDLSQPCVIDVQTAHPGSTEGGSWTADGPPTTSADGPAFGSSQEVDGTGGQTGNDRSATTQLASTIDRARAEAFDSNDSQEEREGRVDRVGFDDALGAATFPDALDSFLQEYGAEGDVLDVLERAIADTGRLDPQWTVTLEIVKNLARHRAANEETISTLVDSIDRLDEDVDDITETLASDDDFDSRFEELEVAIDRLSRDVAAMDDVVQDCRATQERIATALAGDDPALSDFDDGFEDDTEDRRTSPPFTQSPTGE